MHTISMALLSSLGATGESADVLKIAHARAALNGGFKGGMGIYPKVNG